MYKFLLNCPEPPAKKTKMSEEKLEGQHKYEKENRKPIFLPRWEKEFTWLKNTEKGMVCVIFAVKMNTLDHLLLDVMISKDEHIGSFITGCHDEHIGTFITGCHDQ